MQSREHEQRVRQVLEDKGVSETSLAGLSYRLYQTVYENYLHELAAQSCRSFQAQKKLRSLGLKLGDQAPGHDVWGRASQGPNSAPYYKCRHCSRDIIATRFAPHLEKCLGLSGRQSVRNAARNTNSSPYVIDRDEDDYDYDDHSTASLPRLRENDYDTARGDEDDDAYEEMHSSEPDVDLGAVRKRAETSDSASESDFDTSSETSDRMPSKKKRRKLNGPTAKNPSLGHIKRDSVNGANGGSPLSRMI